MEGTITNITIDSRDYDGAYPVVVDMTMHTTHKSIGELWNQLKDTPNRKVTLSLQAESPTRREKSSCIKKVLYRNPYVITFWSDGTKTTSKCQEGDIYNPEVGLLLNVAKKKMGGNAVSTLFSEWVPEAATKENTQICLKDVLKAKKAGK